MTVTIKSAEQKNFDTFSLFAHTPKVNMTVSKQYSIIPRNSQMIPFESDILSIVCYLFTVS